MPLLVTPRQLTERAELYHQLASLTGAGIGLVPALEKLSTEGSNRSTRTCLRLTLEHLQDGATLSDALASGAPHWLPPFDAALIRTGEETGRLDACFRLLANYYREQAALTRQVLADLAYPLFIVHFALLIFPTSWLVRLVWQGDVLGFLAVKGAVLAPCYALFFFLVWASQRRKSERWRAAIEGILRPVPLLGAARSSLALARLSVALESLLNAGISILQAWPLAAAVSGSSALRRAVSRWESNVLAGQTPAEAVRESGAFPDLFTSLYATGEVSGRLDDALERLHRHYQEEASTKLRAFAQWMPRLVYLVVMLVIAYQIICFWTGYFTQINDLTS